MPMIQWDDPEWWKFLVYGPSGSGKSRLGVTSPDPLILLGEPQAAVIIKRTARELGKPVPPTFLINDFQQLQDAVRILRAHPEPCRELARLHGGDPGAVAYARPQTVVLDSGTEFIKLIEARLYEQIGKPVAKDGLPENSIRFLVTLRTRVDSFFRAVRDLPFHVLMLALMDDREVGDGEEKARVVTPMLGSRKMPELAAAAVNAVGLMQVRAQRAKKKGEDVYQEHSVLFHTPSFVRTKILRPLRDKEEPDVTSWIDRLSGGAEDNGPGNGAQEES
jgi:hypothetical protein